MNDPKQPSLLVFADDWGRHPSSCQHLIKRMLPDYRVWWVNTIGMRPPQINLATMRRGMEKLRHWTTKEQREDERPANLNVVNPRMWPWFRRRHDRSLNRRLLLRTLTPLVKSMPQPVVAVTTLPIVADLVGLLPVERWLYYCVDDFSVWPGLDQAAMARMDQELIRKVDRVVAVSDTLRESLFKDSGDVPLLTHGVDLEFWREPQGASALSVIEGLETPLVVFWGVIDRRMDTEFVERLANDMTSGTILLVGPQDNPDPDLLKLPRVVSLPPMPHEQLPALAAAAAVLVMPYQDIAVTRAMQPLKLKEYLATGRPAVVRNLPSVAAWSDSLDAVDTAGQFSAAVRLRLVEGTTAKQQLARKRLIDESWDAKARQFEELLLDPGRLACTSNSNVPLCSTLTATADRPT
jgi:glycosyltransferase involved in cell wall biosynthesis